MPGERGWSAIKANLNWHLIGLLPLAFGILGYAISISNSVPLWGLLWACPFTAVLSGTVLLLLPRNRFAVSAVVLWIINGPLMPALFETAQMLQPGQLHHFASAAVLPVIIYHRREIWNTKGALFGIASFYAFTIITVNLSGGVVNLLDPFKRMGLPPIWLGLVCAIAAFAILLWHELSRSRE